MFRAYTELLSAIRSGNAAILCGAGVSAREPSRLPLASQLVEEIKRRLVGEYLSYLPYVAMRPEVFFQIIGSHASEPLMDHLEAILGYSQPNANHFLIARCLEFGNSIITTNFDTLIETACHIADVDCKVTTGRSPGGASIVFKIHGSLHDRNSVQLTINSVHKGLGPLKNAQLRSMVEDRDVLVLGYSGLDQLDIMPGLMVAPFRRIYWLAHATEGLGRSSHSPTAEVACLPRLVFAAGETSGFVDRCLEDLGIRLPDSRVMECSQLGNAQPPSPNRATQARITVDILMHLNEYGSLINLIDSRGLHGDTFIDFMYFEAGATRRRTRAWRKRKRELFQEALSLQGADRHLLLDRVARYAESEEEVLAAAQVILPELDVDEGHTEVVLVAAIELSYMLILHRRYAEAKRVLERVKVLAVANGYLVAEARALVEEAYLCHELHSSIGTGTQLLRQGLVACQRALFLLSDEIFGDGYFLHQARLNQANLLSAAGHHVDAEHLYQSVEGYFLDRSPNNVIAVAYGRAVTAVATKDWTRSKLELGKIRQMNRTLRRRYMMGFVERLSAIVALRSCGDSATGLKEAKKRLKRSIRYFECEGNIAEARVSHEALDDLG